jgi:hypothetical protein
MKLVSVLVSGMTVLLLAGSATAGHRGVRDPGPVASEAGRVSKELREVARKVGEMNLERRQTRDAEVKIDFQATNRGCRPAPVDPGPKAR